MATDPKPAVATPSVPVSTGRLIPWSTEEDELLRQARPAAQRSPCRGRRNPIPPRSAPGSAHPLRASAHASHALAQPHRTAASHCGALGCCCGR